MTDTFDELNLRIRIPASTTTTTTSITTITEITKDKDNPEFPSPIHSLSPIEHEEDIDTRIVVSVGILAFSPDLEKVLLVRRKDTMAYVEFIRGKYKSKDTKYLQFLLENMTNYEQNTLLTTLSFEELWSKLWIIKTSKSFTKNFETAKHKFESCIHKVRHIIPHLQHHTPIPKYRLEPEWGIPKGRRNRYESNINCALREFEEETGISVVTHSTSDFILEYPSSSSSSGLKPIEVSYIGTNHIHYKLIVYPAICHRKDVGVDPHNKHQQREISAVEWTSLELAKKRLEGIEIDYEEILKKGLNYFRSE
jgi:8-oxo-dGTP pyrophosphatase MutT (NUDIX family)